MEPEKKAEIERLERIKLEEIKTRELTWDPDDYTKEAAEKGSRDTAAKGDENGEAGAGADDGGDVGEGKLEGLSL